MKSVTVKLRSHCARRRASTRVDALTSSNFRFKFQYANYLGQFVLNFTLLLILRDICTAERLRTKCSQQFHCLTI